MEGAAEVAVASCPPQARVRRYRSHSGVTRDRLVAHILSLSLSRVQEPAKILLQWKHNSHYPRQRARCAAFALVILAPAVVLLANVLCSSLHHHGATRLRALGLSRGHEDGAVKFDLALTRKLLGGALSSRHSRLLTIDADDDDHLAIEARLEILDLGLK